MLSALGLMATVGCDDGCSDDARPCLDMPPEDMGPCLEAPPEPDVAPCLEQVEPAPWPGEPAKPSVCLRYAPEPRTDPPPEPCLDLPAEHAPGPCLKVAPEPAPPPKDDGRMCLSEYDPETDGHGALTPRDAVEDVLARGVLPDDVADLLRSRKKG